MVLTQKSAWLLLLFAGLVEASWAILMRATEGFTKPVPTALAIVFGLANVYLLSVVFRYIPIAPAYSIWVGIGVVGATLAGQFLFHDKISVTQVGFIFVVLVGIVGVKMAAP